jgi:hypothetical protein
MGRKFHACLRFALGRVLVGSDLKARLNWSREPLLGERRSRRQPVNRSRRKDCNVPEIPGMRCSFGRLVYGALVKLGIMRLERVQGLDDAPHQATNDAVMGEPTSHQVGLRIGGFDRRSCLSRRALRFGWLRLGDRRGEHRQSLRTARVTIRADSCRDA